MGEFIAFKAAMALLEERGMRYVIDSVYHRCKEQDDLPKEEVVNYVREIYAPSTDEEVAAKIAELLTPEGTRAEIEIVFQSVEAMHKAIPDHPGDWYFTGNYPTPGGKPPCKQSLLSTTTKAAPPPATDRLCLNNFLETTPTDCFTRKIFIIFVFCKPSQVAFGLQNTKFHNNGHDRKSERGYPQ